MRQGLAILLTACLEGWATLHLPAPVAVLLGWVALVTGVVGTSAMAGWTGLLGKTDDGHLPSWSLVVFWPWHLLARGLAPLVPRLTGEPTFTEAHPGWLIGGWPTRADAFSDWPAVVDVTAELPRRGPAADYVALPTWDGTAPSQANIDRGVAFALEQRRRGRPVLFHCAAGHSRSATVLAAALVADGLHPTWQDAIAHLRSVRPWVTLGVEQRAALRTWTSRRASPGRG